MIRHLRTLMILTAVLLVAFVQPVAALNLKSHSVITEDAITLGDVFLGLSDDRAAKVLGASPRPGSDMVLNARTLLRIAVAMDLPWRPQHSGEHVVLTRSATVIEQSMIEEALKSKIDADGMTGSYDIAFNGALSDLFLPPEHAPSVDVHSISMHPTNGRFDAVLVAPSKDLPLQTMQVSGYVHRVINVPILRDTIRSGHVIRARDLEMVSIREHAVKSDMALNAQDLIGMTPRRVMTSGKPVSLNDLEAPQIVGRGDFVTIHYSYAGMKLAAQGKALENGAKGDVIRVSNSASNRTLDAIVSGDRAVTIERF